jgi:hypothetical protein
MRDPSLEDLAVFGEGYEPEKPIHYAPFDDPPVDDEAWLADRVGGTAEATRGTKLMDLGLDGDTLVRVFLDGHEHLQLAFPGTHMDARTVPVRTYGELQDAFRDARAAKNHPHTAGSVVPGAIDPRAVVPKL